MSVAQPLSITGDFTTLRYLVGFDASALERRIGFDSGRLAPGFTLVALAEEETLAPDDFELKASTRWSAGAVGGKHGVGGEQIEPILLRRGLDLLTLKERVCKFFARRGKNTPAKILPNLRHTPGMRYPDAEALGPGQSSGVPQFKLLVPKRFIIISEA